MAYDPEKRLRAWSEYSQQLKEKEKKEELLHKEQNAAQERSWKEKMYVDTDKPGTMDNGTATLWYIIIMVIGAVFNDRWLIWIFATIIWSNHINRKARRQKEWDKKQEEKKNGGYRS